MTLVRCSAAALASGLVVLAGATPCFADDPPRPPKPSATKLDEDRGAVRTPPPQMEEDRGSLGQTLPPLPAPAPAAPTAPAPAAPPVYSPPGYPPPGYAPPGYPQGAHAPPSYYPPPAYSPAPGYSPPSYSAPPGYSPPPGYWPAPPDGSNGEIRVGRGRVYGEEMGYPDPDIRRQRRASTGMIIAGVSGVGVGWLGASLHGLMGDLTGFGEYRAIFIPVVGPLIEATTHRGAFSSGEEIGLVFEGVLQIGGLASFVVGMAVRPDKRSSASLPFRMAVQPVVTSRGASLGVVGAF